MTDIRNWSLTASLNGTLGSPPDYWPEGQAPSTVNDCSREGMRAIKKQFLDAAWVDLGRAVTYISATKFSISSATSTAIAYYAVNKRIRALDATTLYGVITEASISATTTNITVILDSGSLSASLSAVAFSILDPAHTPIPPTIGGMSQNSNEIYAADAQANDTYVITLAPAVTSYTAGLMINFKANTVNTGAATLNVNGLGAKSILRPGGAALEDGDIAAAQVVTVVYDGTNFIMESQSQRAVYQYNQQIYAADSGAANVYVTTLSPAILTLKTGFRTTFLAANANTAAATLNVNGIGAKAIKKYFNVALDANDILAGQMVEVVYDGTNFQMVSSPGRSVSEVVLIASGTAANSATLDITGIFSTAYDMYVIELDAILPQTTARKLVMRVGTGAGPTYDTGGNYGWTGSSVITNSTAPLGSASLTDTSINLTFCNGNSGVSTGGTGVFGKIVLVGPVGGATDNLYGTYQTTFLAASGAPDLASTTGGFYNSQQAAYTAIRFFYDSGNIVSGTVRVYGVRNV